MFRSGVSSVARSRYVARNIYVHWRGPVLRPLSTSSALWRGVKIATRITVNGLVVPMVFFGIGFSVVSSMRASELVEEEKVDPYEAEIEKRISELAVVKSLRADSKFEELRPHKNGAMAETVTSGALRGRGRISVPPFIFVNHETHELVAVMHLGENLCGHPGMVHGGLLATVMDEGLCGAAFTALPNRIGVTANLNLNYRASSPTDHVYVLRAKVTDAQGRKVWAQGELETVPEKGKKPVVVCDGQVLVVQPKWASMLPAVFTSSRV